MKVNAPRSQPPQSLPVLTEVVVMPEAAIVDSQFPDTQQPESPYQSFQNAAAGTNESAVMSPAQVDENMLVERVLHDLERQIDLMFEQRLREAMGPSLARITDMLVRETRNELALTLREMVSRAVQNELARHQR
jgi:hypothetical protein